MISDKQSKKIKENQTKIKQSKKSKEINDMARGGKRERSGRPKGSTEIPQLPRVKLEIKHELRELAREYTGAALEALVKVCKEGATESARVAAANSLLDRGYGKPLQQHEVGGLGDLDRLSSEELLAILEEPVELIEHSEDTRH